MNILITGAAGFVGKNLTAALEAIRDGKDRRFPDLTIGEIYRYDMDSTEADLENACQKADFVFNLAGVNRPQNQEEFMQGNFGFASTLLDTLKKHNNKCPVMLSSSIQAKLDNDYGKSKKQSEDALIKYSDECGAKLYIFRLPNLFGKWCRPNYNSAVATFCHNIAHDLDVWINDPAIELNLVYIDDLVASIIDIIEDENIVKLSNLDEEVAVTTTGASSIQIDKYYYEVTTVYKRTLGNIVDSLKMFRNMRKSLLIPDLSDGFNKALYSTYLTYLEEDDFSYYLDKKEDTSSQGKVIGIKKK